MVRASSQPVEYLWLPNDDISVCFVILREAGRPTAFRFAWATSGILQVRWSARPRNLNQLINAHCIFTRMFICMRKWRIQMTSSTRIASNCGARWRWSVAGTARTLALSSMPPMPPIARNSHHRIHPHQRTALPQEIAATDPALLFHRAHRILPPPRATEPIISPSRRPGPPSLNSPSSSRPPWWRPPGTMRNGVAPHRRRPPLPSALCAHTTTILIVPMRPQLPSWPIRSKSLECVCARDSISEIIVLVFASFCTAILLYVRFHSGLPLLCMILCCVHSRAAVCPAPRAPFSIASNSPPNSTLARCASPRPTHASTR